MIMKSTREALRIRSWAALTLAAALTTTAPIAQAALTSYSPAGVDLVRLQNGPLDLTLTANGNLLGNFLALRPAAAALPTPSTATEHSPPATSAPMAAPPTLAPGPSSTTSTARATAAPTSGACPA